MDLIDILSGGSEYVRENRPSNLDMDRLMEIALELKGEINRTASNPALQADTWTARVKSLCDFDALGWQALQVAFSLFNIESGADLIMLRMNPDQNMHFVRTIQAFYDGFITGAEFQKRGGHRD